MRTFTSRALSLGITLTPAQAEHEDRIQDACARYAMGALPWPEVQKLVDQRDQGLVARVVQADAKRLETER